MAKLYNLISKLSKASPESVHTFHTDSTSIFEYLHIETPVETEYINILENQRKNKSIIFLCGSSGDGKSAIIAKNKTKFETDYNFHVDATHSFKPNQTAIEALDESFHEYSKNQKSLVVGINIGILMNYVIEGDESHNEIKEAINSFLKNKKNESNIYFINFEDYSKFEFEEHEISSIFIKSLFEKITLQSNANSFYEAFLIDKENNQTSFIHQNFKLLSIEAIQNSIIELLITVNLKYDQFITTRSLLDFIYTLLSAPNTLINQLFEDDSNIIIKNIRKEDPVLIRSYQLDKFILERASEKEDKSLTEFINKFNQICTKEILDEKYASSIIRVFYLFRNNDISNNYHQKFINNFDDRAIHNFVHLVAIHKAYDNENKKAIQAFYKEIKGAILFYVNKKIPTLSKKGLLTLSNTKTVTTAVPVEIAPNWSEIKAYTSKSFSHFPLFLKVNSAALIEIEITLNMLIMINLINSGYRPNKHDRNTIILFDELIQLIIEKATDLNEIILILDNKKVRFKNIEDEIEVVEYED